MSHESKTISEEINTERPAILKKKKQVNELYNNLKGAKMFAFIKLKNLPDNLFQNTRKLLRKDAKIFVYKKVVAERAFKKLGYNDLSLIKYFKEPVAILISNNITPYKLYWFFQKNKLKRAAKPGEIAPFDIIVPAGETDFPPGPILSELKAAKIQARVQKGKIVIADDSLVAKKGDIITETVAKALQKLDILPFDVNVELLIAQSDGIMFSPELLSISSEQLTQDIKSSFMDGYSLSINANVPTKDNIELLLNKTYMQGYSLGLNQQIYSPEVIEALIQKAITQTKGFESFTKK
ncbi:50S ribosomal protein L10 [Candidatus Micrarchaeota archaeon]|nr:50S ribosomal protein L10 [Candidatus Micrarchaeota archaeon]